ncbi:unannotated protein [freshwater metagenome]|uniref:Unannotated protein n=1 Tax=freshwater metagenome TaxID=449393 RepID=A0A6J7S905_9ZZZZ
MQRVNGDAWGLHVDDDHGDAFVLWRILIRADC